MKNKDFLSILDLGDGEVDGIISKAASIKQGNTPQILSGKIVALVFEKPSLRTRVSFEVGVKQMGGTCIFLSNNEIGLGVREPEADVAKVLDRLVDCIVARVFSHHSLELLAENTSIPIVNALSDQAHPCQALGDCLTIYERKGGLEGLKLAFVGDGNNIAGSLALACSSAGMDFNIASPPDYRLPEDIWNQARIMAKKRGTTIRWTEDPEDAVSEADVVYTDVWVSMGDEEEKKERISVFSSYQVNEQLVKFAKDDFLFMHDMPAHRGEEISDGMLEHPNSVVFHQAENRLHAQKAVLAELFGY
ncbi:MAG TPA: ornithine carbamoyltransferase [Dehalococcoidia bacterium]|nr:ornithine carbamoyltransferase [Dehalococcoidia bacterium]